MKHIGKPCTGKPYARFDEGGQVFLFPTLRAPGMALFRYTWWWPDDLAVQVRYRPGKGND